MFRVWFAGSADQLYADTVDEAEAEFGGPEDVQAASEADAVFAYNRAVRAAPEDGERYFIRRIVEQPLFVADVAFTDDGKPIVRSWPA